MSMSDDPLIYVVRVLAWVVCIVWVAFAGRYAVRTWWRSHEGRHLMSMCLALAGTFFYVGILPWLDVSARVKIVITCSVYVALGAIGLHRHWLLTRADREARREAADAPITGDD